MGFLGNNGSSSSSSSNGHDRSTDQAKRSKAPKELKVLEEKRTPEELSLREFLDALDGLVKAVSDTKFNIQGADPLLAILELVQGVLKDSQYQYGKMDTFKSFLNHFYNSIPKMKVMKLLPAFYKRFSAKGKEGAEDKEDKESKQEKVETLDTDEASDGDVAKGEQWLEENVPSIIKLFKDPAIQQQLYDSGILRNLQEALLTLHEVLQKPHALAFLQSAEAKNLIKKKAEEKPFIFNNALSRAKRLYKGTFISPQLSELLQSDDARDVIRLSVETLYCLVTGVHVHGVARFEGKPPVEQDEPPFNSAAILKEIPTLFARNQRFGIMNFINSVLTNQLGITTIQDKLSAPNQEETLAFFNEHIKQAPALMQFIQNNEQALTDIVVGKENKKLLIDAYASIMGQTITDEQAKNINSIEYVLFGLGIHIAIIQRILLEKFFPLIKENMTYEEKIGVFQKLKDLTSQDFSKLCAPFVVSNEGIKKLLGLLFSGAGVGLLQNLLTLPPPEGGPNKPAPGEIMKLFLGLETCPPSFSGLINTFFDENYIKKMLAESNVEERFKIQNEFVGKLVKERARLHDLLDGFVADPKELDLYFDKKPAIDTVLRQFIDLHIAELFTRDFKGFSEENGYPIFKKLSYRRIEKLSSSIVSKNAYHFDVDSYINYAFIDSILTRLNNTLTGANLVEKIRQAKSELEDLCDHFGADHAYYHRKLNGVIRAKLAPINELLATNVVSAYSQQQHNQTDNIAPAAVEQAQKHQASLVEIANIIGVEAEFLQKDFDEALKKEIKKIISFPVNALCHVKSAEDVEIYQNGLKKVRGSSVEHLEALLGFPGYANALTHDLIKAQLTLELDGFILREFSLSALTEGEAQAKQELSENIKIKFKPLLEAYLLIAGENGFDKKEVLALVESSFLKYIRRGVKSHFYNNFVDQVINQKITEQAYVELVKTFFDGLPAQKAHYYMLCDIVGVNHGGADALFSEITETALKAVSGKFVHDHLVKQFKNNATTFDPEAENKLYTLILRLAGYEKPVDTYDVNQNPEVLIQFINSNFKTLLSDILADGQFTLTYLLAHPEHFLHFVKTEWKKTMSGHHEATQALAKDLASGDSPQEKQRKSTLCATFKAQYQARSKAIVERNIGYTQEQFDALTKEKTEDALVELFTGLIDYELISVYNDLTASDEKIIKCMSFKQQMKKAEADQLQIASTVGVSAERLKTIQAQMKLNALGKRIHAVLQRHLLNIRWLHDLSAKEKISQLESCKSKLPSLKAEIVQLASALAIENFNVEQFFNKVIKDKIHADIENFVSKHMPVLLVSAEEKFKQQAQVKFTDDLDDMLEEQRQYASLIGMSDEALKAHVINAMLSDQKAKDIFDEEALQSILDISMDKVLAQYTPRKQRALAAVKIEISTEQLEKQKDALAANIKTLTDSVIDAVNLKKEALDKQLSYFKQQLPFLELAADFYKEDEVLANAQVKLKGLADDIEAHQKGELLPLEEKRKQHLVVKARLEEKKGQLARNIAGAAEKSLELNARVQQRDHALHEATIRSAKWWAIPKRVVGCFIALLACFTIRLIPYMRQIRKEAVDANVGVWPMLHLFEHMGTFGYRKENTVLSKIQARNLFFKTAVYNAKTAEHSQFLDEQLAFDAECIKAKEAADGCERSLQTAKIKETFLKGQHKAAAEDLKKRTSIMEEIEKLSKNDILAIQQIIRSLEEISVDKDIEHNRGVKLPGENLKEPTQPSNPPSMGTSATAKLKRWATSMSFGKSKSKVPTVSNLNELVLSHNGPGTVSDVGSTSSRRSSFSAVSSTANGSAMNPGATPSVGSTPLAGKRRKRFLLF